MQITGMCLRNEQFFVLAMTSGCNIWIFQCIELSQFIPLVMWSTWVTLPWALKNQEIILHWINLISLCILFLFFFITCTFHLHINVFTNFKLWRICFCISMFCHVSFTLLYHSVPFRTMNNKKKSFFHEKFWNCTRSILYQFYSDITCQREMWYEAAQDWFNS